MKKVAIYVRVSTLEQAESGYSISEQIDKLKKYCEIHDWAVYDTYSDPGFSGSNTSRPALSKLCGDAKRKLFDSVLVYKLDRLSRSQKDTLHLIEEIFIPNDIDFISLNENFDTSSAFGKAMIGILSVFAQLEREQIKERMQLGKLGRAKSGKPMMWAQTSFGYDYDTKTGTMSINQAHAIIVKQIFNEYISGLSIIKLRDKLNSEGHIGKDRNWSHRTVKSVLENPVYCGLIRYQGQIFDGNHEQIITKEMFDSVQKELKIRQQAAYELNKNPRPFKAKYMLSGSIRCGYCGAPLNVTLGTVRKDGSRSKRYVCKNRNIGKHADATIYNNNKKCEYNGWYELSDIEENVLAEIFKLQYDKKILDDMIPKSHVMNKDIKSIEKQIKKLENKLSKMSDLYVNDLITLDELKYKTDDILKEKRLLESELSDEVTQENADKMKSKEVKKTLGKKSIYELTYEKQKFMVNKLIYKVDVTADTIKINWKFLKHN